MKPSLLENHLQQISDNYDAILPPDQKTYLKRLKDEGYEPLVIYDIGAGALTWTRYAKSLWPNSIFIVFDATESFKTLYESLNFEHHIGCLLYTSPSPRD